MMNTDGEKSTGSAYYSASEAGCPGRTNARGVPHALKIKAEQKAIKIQEFYI